MSQLWRGNAELSLLQRKMSAQPQAGSTGRRNTLCLEGKGRGTGGTSESFFEASPLRQRNRDFGIAGSARKALGVSNPSR